MAILEVGYMVVKPGSRVMDLITSEGQILQKTWETIKNTAGGPNWIYWGLELEDTSRIWTFFEWDSIEEHEKFAKSHGAEAVKDLPTILSHSIFVKHIDLNMPLAPILQSPTVRIMLNYFPSNISLDEQNKIGDQIQQESEKLLIENADISAVSFGWGVERDFAIPDEVQQRTGSVIAAFFGLPTTIASPGSVESRAADWTKKLHKHIEGMIASLTVHVECRSLEAT